MSQLKIVVNTRLLRKNELDGIGWFEYNTLKHIVTNHPGIQFHFLFDSGIDNEFLFANNITPHNLFPPAKHAVLNIAWFEWSVKNVLKSINPNLFLSPDGILCLGWKGKQYSVIHDINFFHNPLDLKWSNRTYYNYYFPKFARKADRIATVSAYSKRDLTNIYNIHPDKIDVVYNGVNSFFKPVNPEIKNQTKEKYSKGKDYFVFIGTLHPRKNLIRLLQAFDLFKDETKSELKILIVGKSLFKIDEVFQLVRSLMHGRDVIFTGRLSNDEVKNILGSSLALVFVPVFEGFGIPIIEAMQCGVPVVCSKTTSMPEVAGEAALMVDPFNVNEIKQAMIDLHNNIDLRNHLISKGRIRKDFFSWQKTSQLLWQSITKCL